MPTDAALPSPATGFWQIALRATIVHTATYFVIGASAFVAFNYTDAFIHGPESLYMRPTSDPMVAAGPLFQPIRGFLFGIIFYLLRDVLFVRPNGWLVCWAMLAILGILNPFSAAPGSIEGAIYLSIPLASQFGLGLIEVSSQSLLLALGTHAWVRQPQDRWLGWGFSIVAGLAVALSLAGIFLRPLAG